MDYSGKMLVLISPDFTDIIEFVAKVDNAVYKVKVYHSMLNYSKNKCMEYDNYQTEELFDHICRNTNYYKWDILDKELFEILYG